MSYWELLGVVVPVFALIGIGVALRRVRWLTAEADASLLKLVVNFLYPCLIFESVLGNAALRDPANLVWPPLIGAATMALGFIIAYVAGGWLGLDVGTGRRTFAFATGIYNYGYIPIPLMAALFGRDSLGVLLVHNVGCEAAIWTVGILVLSGLSLREGWKRLLNPPVAALLLGVALNLVGAAPHVPDPLRETIHLGAVCAIPLGLLLIGATLEPFGLETPQQLVDARVTPASCALRLGLIPVLFLLLAKFLPVTPELKRVMIVQAAMPAGILPIVIAKHYGGRPVTAAQIVVGTQVLGLLTIPLWVQFGLRWVLGEG